jgi:hypothetical protein
MIQKLRGTLAIAAVIVLIATGPVVAQVWFQAANAQSYLHNSSGQVLRLGGADVVVEKIVNKAKLLFGVNLPFGRVL